MTVVKRHALFLLGKKQKTKIKPTVRKKNGVQKKKTLVREPAANSTVKATLQAV